MVGIKECDHVLENIFFYFRGKRRHKNHTACKTREFNEHLGGTNSKLVKRERTIDE
jgi:hypothetical protein